MNYTLKNSCLVVANRCNCGAIWIISVKSLHTSGRLGYFYWLALWFTYFICRKEAETKFASGFTESFDTKRFFGLISYVYVLSCLTHTFILSINSQEEPCSFYHLSWVFFVLSILLYLIIWKALFLSLIFQNKVNLDYFLLVLSWLMILIA